MRRLSTLALGFGLAVLTTPAFGAEPVPAAPPAPTGAAPGAAAAPTPTVTPTPVPTAPRPLPAADLGGRPAGMSPAESLAWDAGDLIDAGNTAAAEVKIRAALAQDPRNPGAHVQLGRLAFLRGDLAGALKEANMALAADPRDTAALYLVLRVQAAQGTAEQSFSRLQALANTHRDDLGVQLAYGEAQLLTEKVDGAIAAVGRVLKKAETSVAAMKLLARAYLALKRPMTAEYVLLRAIELDRDPEALTLLAGIRFDEGKVVEARVLLEEAVQRAPGYLEALNSLGCVYIEVRNYEAAEEVLQRTVAVAPGFAEGWLDLGSAQRGAGRFEAAEGSWKKTLELDKKRAEAWFDLGVLYLENPLPGRDRVKQLIDAINAFNGYKVGAGKDADPRADKYIGEARLLQKQEEDRRKEQLKTPPAEGGTEQPEG
ncbi:MAG: hypothetical protein CVU56_15430 [Deltaproteobacteria bacterium HGW-Deltaproteobacteria-14]|jgi:tetratricopeptide (TPR) repeat protein|nr:MAG: hypothetical protein CVU56_15430 [Deltaproteobacteria bacterium HGW-Deltaproteobacteria-14]